MSRGRDALHGIRPTPSGPHASRRPLPTKTELRELQITVFGCSWRM